VRVSLVTKGRRQTRSVLWFTRHYSAHVGVYGELLTHAADTILILTACVGERRLCRAARTSWKIGDRLFRRQNQPVLLLPTYTWNRVLSYLKLLYCIWTSMWNVWRLTLWCSVCVLVDSQCKYVSYHFSGTYSNQYSLAFQSVSSTSTAVIISKCFVWIMKNVLFPIISNEND